MKINGQKSIIVIEKIIFEREIEEFQFKTIITSNDYENFNDTKFSLSRYIFRVITKTHVMVKVHKYGLQQANKNIRICSFWITILNAL